MHVEGYTVPQAWHKRTVGYLTRREAENNLVLGLGAALISDASAYSDFYLAAVARDDQIVGAAVMTVPYNLVLAHTEDDGALDALCGHISRHFSTLPGVSARKDVAHEFARLWTARTGQSHEVDMAQRIYQLHTVKPPVGVPGALRIATADDVPMLARWQHAFSVETGLEMSPERSRMWAQRLFTSTIRRMWFWEAGGKPVCMAGSTGPTPNGIRIGPVYTPPECRGRGYASACTAAVSQLMLDEGRTFCFLYTDLDNPTSNKIYQDIGYAPVCDADIIRFGGTDG